MKYRASGKNSKRWDAGETGCSGLIVGVRQRIERLRQGEKLEVVARNAGAAVDLWVWCRMTGHRLISEAPPHFVIERK